MGEMEGGSEPASLQHQLWSLKQVALIEWLFAGSRDTASSHLKCWDGYSDQSACFRP